MALAEAASWRGGHGAPFSASAFGSGFQMEHVLCVNLALHAKPTWALYPHSRVFGRVFRSNKIGAQDMLRAIFFKNPERISRIRLRLLIRSRVDSARESALDSIA